MKKRLSSLAIAILLTVNSIVPGSVPVSAAEPISEIESVVQIDNENSDVADDVFTDENSDTEIEVIETDDEASYEETTEESVEDIELLEEDPAIEEAEDPEAELSIEDSEGEEAVVADPDEVYGMTGYALSLMRNSRGIPRESRIRKYFWMTLIMMRIIMSQSDWETVPMRPDILCLCWIHQELQAFWTPMVVLFTQLTLLLPM